MGKKRARERNEPDVELSPPHRHSDGGGGGRNRVVSQGSLRPDVSISNPMTRNGPPGAPVGGRDADSRASSHRGYSAAMASDAIFHMFPEPGEQQGDGDVYKISEVDRFIQKHYPMLYLNLNANPDQPSLVDVQYENEGAACPLCELDRNTLDSIKVLKPNQVKVYLESYNYKFTEEQVNVHLAHTVRDENVIGVIQNMSVDLISKSYSLASAASLRVMNRVRTHMGRPFFVPDQDVAKVHTDAVKQFIGLASTCQALMKYKHSDSDKGPLDGPLL